MSISLPVPQDIVYEIIDKLHNSADTLKSCASVARSFLIPSRKKLFATIRLTTESAQRLLPILKQHPDISSYILDVTITSISPDLSNRALVDVLVSLECLQQLTIELGPWKPPQNHQPTLENLLLCPRFTALAINGNVVLSSSVINRLRMKKLRLWGVMVQNSGTAVEEDIEESSILETLDLLVWSIPDQRLEPLRLFRNVYGLRELVVRMKWGYEKTLSLGRDIIARSADSINHIALYYDSGAYITPDLGLTKISNLRFLSFSLQYLCADNEEPDKFRFDWESILDILRDSHVTRNLEELSVVIKFRPVEVICDVMRGLHAWSDLDGILGSTAPKLRKVNLYMDGCVFDDLMGNERLQRISDDNFSSLHKKGVIISCSNCDSSAVDLRRW